MTVLEQVKEMQQQGFGDAEIIQRLKEQSVPPLEIQEALEQSQIRAAVSDEAGLYPNQMQPSVMQQQTGQMQQFPQYQEQPQAPEAYAQYQEQAGQEQQTPSPGEYYQQPQMPQFPQYQQYSSSSSENMTEIAEQIAEEKINAFRKKLGNIDEIKVLLVKQVDVIEERLKKIESVIDLIQKAVISKIGSYGDSVEEIKDEMKMMQESFSKALNPLVEKSRHGKQSEEKHKKRSDGFEHYLRR